MDILPPALISQATFTTIGMVMSRYPVSDEAMQRLKPNMSPEQGVAVLQQDGLERDAIQLTAHFLPVMPCIRWGYNQISGREGLPDDQQHLVELVSQWLASPNETIRIRLQQLADRTGLDNACAWLAYAVFWCGTGSIVAPDLPVVLPPDNMVGHAVNAAILLYLCGM